MSISGTSVDPRARGRLFVAAALAMFVFGMIIAILGTLFGLPAMRERLGIDLARQGDLFSVLFIGLLASTAVVGPTVDRFGSKVVFAVGVRPCDGVWHGRRGGAAARNRRRVAQHGDQRSRL
jgi:MFS family permease